MSVTRTGGPRPTPPTFIGNDLVAGKEFKTLDELKRFATTHKTLTLRAGESFSVYVPMLMGSGTQLRGFNKDSAFGYKVLKNKAAPVRMPGQWLQISAKSTAKSGYHDNLKFVRTPVLAPGHTPKTSTVFGFKMQVIPRIILNPIRPPQ
jgi:hypothetical protein